MNRPDPKAATAPSKLARRLRIGLAVALLLLLIGVIFYYVFRTRPGPPVDPKFQETGVTIEGTVTCNGEALPGGYVVAWQGPPVAFGEIQAGGSFRLNNAPLGKCILTVSAMPPEGSWPTPRLLQSLPKEGGMPGKEDFGGAKGKGKGPKEKGKKGFKFKDAKPGPDMPFPPGDKGFPKDKDFPGGGALDGKMPPPKQPDRELTPEQQEVVKSTAGKYSDPAQKLIEVETKKGTNRFRISLTVP